MLPISLLGGGKGYPDGILGDAVRDRELNPPSFGQVIDGLGVGWLSSSLKKGHFGGPGDAAGEGRVSPGASPVWDLELT